MDTTPSIRLTPDLYQRLEQVAQRQHRSLEETLYEALEEYIVGFDETDDSIETIQASFLQGWHEAMTDAPTRNIWDVLAEIEHDEQA